LSHPDMENCAYVAMPGPLLGEKICTFIVAEENAKMILESMNNFLLNDQKIAKFKLLEPLELLDALPLANVGKVNKKQLWEIIAGKIEQERNYGKR